MATPSDFFEQMSPYAYRASQAIGVPVSVILAQWGLESGYGSSRFATEGLNFGGIKLSTASPTKEYMVQSGSGAKFAKYSSIDQFVDDYVRVLGLSYYTAVRAADTPAAAMAALSASPYDAGHYAGGKLQKIFDSYGLAVYDERFSGVQQAGPVAGASLPIPESVLTGDSRFLGWFLIGAGVLIIIKALGGSTEQVREVAEND